MENDIRKILQKKVFDGLKSKIDASIYVKITNDALQVKIKKLGLSFGTAFDDIFNRAAVEPDISDRIINDTYKQYKAYVLTTFLN